MNCKNLSLSARTFLYNYSNFQDDSNFLNFLISPENLDPLTIDAWDTLYMSKRKYQKDFNYERLEEIYQFFS